MKKIILLAAGTCIAFLGQAQNNSTYKVGYVETGTISYYPSDEGKRKTESGEEYDMTAMEAAHRYLPFGTLLKVTNVDTNKEVLLRINDRPNSTERIMDVTLAAADSLGMVKKDLAVLFVRSEIVALGVTRTKNLRGILATAPSPTKTKNEKNTPEKVTKTDEKTAAKATEKPKQEQPNTVKTKEQPKEKTVAQKETPKKEEKKAEKTVKNAPAAAKTTEKVEKVEKTEKPTQEEKANSKFDAVGFYNGAGAKQTPTGFGIQTGLFTELDRALAEIKTLEGMKLGKVYLQTIEQGGKKSYKVLVGTFKSKDETKDVITKLKEKNYQPFAKKFGE
ncbi:MAG: RlpA-like double-psi beta-barrel domain-containing protein [Thermoflexibacteraceae bacterium]